MDAIAEKLTESDQRILASLPSVQYGQALMRFIALSLKFDREEFRIGSKICDDPLCDDFRWKLGGISKLEGLEMLPNICERILSRPRKGEKR